MINFREKPQMFLAKPKRFMAVYTDLTMPQRDWKSFDKPSYQRIKPRAKS